MIKKNQIIIIVLIILLFVVVIIDGKKSNKSDVSETEYGTPIDYPVGEEFTPAFP
jgi:hypothetical protein